MGWTRAATKRLIILFFGYMLDDEELIFLPPAFLENFTCAFLTPPLLALNRFPKP
jgi:hypothetical protein